MVIAYDRNTLRNSDWKFFLRSTDDSDHNWIYMGKKIFECKRCFRVKDIEVKSYATIDYNDEINLANTTGKIQFPDEI